LRVPYEAGVTLDSMANVGNDYSLGVELSTQLKVKVIDCKVIIGTRFLFSSRIYIIHYLVIVNISVDLPHKGGRILFGLSIWLFVSSCSVLICNRPSPFGIYSILPVTEVTLRQPIYNRSHGFNRNSL